MVRWKWCGNLIHLLYIFCYFRVITCPSLFLSFFFPFFFLFLSSLHIFFFFCGFNSFLHLFGNLRGCLDFFFLITHLLTQFSSFITHHSSLITHHLKYPNFPKPTHLALIAQFFRYFLFQKKKKKNPKVKHCS